MKGLIHSTLTGLCLGTGLVSLAGCCNYRQWVDPCWPERYAFMSRHSVRDTTNAQAANGHLLDQTIWNWHFEVDPKTGAPSDKLTGAGMEHLKYLTRRRPGPDPKLYLQTAQDIPINDKTEPEKLAQARADLDQRRIQAIQKFLSIQMAGRTQPVAFEVAIHDPTPVGIYAQPIVTNSLPALYGNFQGTIPDTLNLGGGGGGGGTSGGGTGGGGVAAQSSSVR
jgi:hypothetical protein